MTIERIRTGKNGERLAASFLKRAGYKLLEKNYRTRLGEIDIIGIEGGCISFIEVRSGDTRNFNSPTYSITRKKQNHIAKAALSYIHRHGLEDKDCRFDVVCIENINSGFPDIQLIKNAFELDMRYRY